MTIKISVVVGNPKPNSRTLRVATRLVEELFHDAPHETSIVDLAAHVGDVLAWPSEAMERLNAEVASSHLVVFASPTYKATYTGLLKAFLDRYPSNGLAGVTAIPLMTGADLGHSMGPTVNLAPLLMELGAVVPGRGFYFVTEHMDRLDEIVRVAADEYVANFRRLGLITSGLPDATAGQISEGKA